MFNVGSIVARLTADTKPFTKAIQGASKQVADFTASAGRRLESFRKSIEKAGDRMKKIGSKASLWFTTPLVGAMSAVSFQALNQVKAVQEAGFGLRAYEKDAEKVNKVLSELVKYAQSDTGVLFQRQDLFEAASALKIYGIETDGLVDKVKIMSKGVSLGKTTFQELAGILGRVSAAGQLTATDFDMLVARGIGLDASMRGSKISAEELFEALDNALPDELLKGRADTIDGQMIRLQSAFRNLGHIILGTNEDANGFMPNSIGDRVLRTLDTLRQFMRSEEFIKLVRHAAERLEQTMGFLEDRAKSLASFFDNLSTSNKELIVDGIMLLAAIGPALIIVGTLLKVFGVLLSPIGLLVIALAGLAGWIAAQEDPMGTVRQGFEWIQNQLKKLTPIIDFARDAFKRVWGVIQSLIPVVMFIVTQVLSALFFAWKRLRDPIMTFLHSVRDMWNAVRPIVMLLLKIIGGVLVVGFQVAFAIIINVLSGFVRFISGIISVISGVVNIIVGIFTGNFGKIGQGFQQVFGGLVNMIRGVIGMIVAPFSGAVEGILNIFRGISWFQVGMNIVNGIIGGLSGLGSRIGSTIRNAVPAGIRNLIPGFASGIQDFAGGLARVNERGGELIGLPQGATVIPASLSQSMLDGLRPATAGVTIQNVTINENADTDRFFRELDRRTRNEKIIG